jgi:2,4-diketo-3-deoxy-L-fuconate hydrolase
MPEEPRVSFRLGTFSRAGEVPFPGLVLDTRVYALGALEPLLNRMGLRLNCADTLLSLFSEWERNFSILEKAAFALSDNSRSAPSAELDSLRIHAPLQCPRQIFCTIANYRSHIVDTLRDPAMSPALHEPDPPELLARAAQVIEERLRGQPYVCLKLPTTVIGPTDPLEIPHHAKRTDWELELGVVISAPCRRVSRERAMDFVAGYMLVNDITIRELVARPDLRRLGSDWLQSKNGPGFLPTGPYLVPAAFVPDPNAIRLQLALNGTLMQDASVSDMLFDIPAQIAYISQHAQLLPGDLICTGTPAGCGTRYKRFLTPGDVIHATAEGFGAQRTTCVSERRT